MRFGALCPSNWCFGYVAKPDAVQLSHSLFGLCPLCCCPTLCLGYVMNCSPKLCLGYGMNPKGPSNRCLGYVINPALLSQSEFGSRHGIRSPN